MTILLTRSEITGLLDVDAALAMLRQGFAGGPAAGGSAAPRRTHTPLPGPGSATALLPGLLDGVPAYTVKVNAKFPGASPALRGLICLHDLSDGRLLAVLDSSALTAWRTGLAAALATHTLAGPDGTVSVIGAGAQARMVLSGLSRMRQLTRLTVCDTERSTAIAFALEHETLLSVPVEAVDDPRKAASLASIVVLATWSREPLLDTVDLRPGMHLTSLGADEPGKVELSAGVLRSARTVVDDPALSVDGGALGNVGLDATAADATLAEVMSGERPGRTADSDVTVYAPVGLPWQDLALTWPVYQAALSQGRGTPFDFLA